jgi:Holliday junction DNA helicase RuvA
VKLYIHDVYREDDQSLYGFATREERDFFRLLVEKVSGIGPRTAIALLSKLSAASIASAVAAGDVALLSKTPGIGKKTAERIVIELRDTLAPGMTHAAPVSGAPALPANPVTDAINGSRWPSATTSTRRTRPCARPWANWGSKPRRRPS